MAVSFIVWLDLDVSNSLGRNNKAGGEKEHTQHSRKCGTVTEDKSVVNLIRVAGCLRFAPERQATAEEDHSGTNHEKGRNTSERDLEPT